MPVFEELFLKSRGQPIEYDGRIVVMMDRFPISNGETVRVVREATNSDWRQGISIRTNGRLSINGISGEQFVLWQESAPNSVTVSVLETDGHLEVKNVWDVGDGVVHSWHNGAAMYIERLRNGCRYHCNDGHPDDDFDDLIFCIER